MKTKKAIKSVFLVDDDDMFLEGLKQHVHQKWPDLNVTCFPTSEACFRSLHLKPELIFLDYHLDKNKITAKDGLFALRKIKSSSNGIFVVMLSSDDTLQIAVDTVKYGAYDYIVKGESAFARLEIVFNNITKQVNAEKEMNIFKVVFFGLVALFSVTVWYFFGSGS